MPKLSEPSSTPHAGTPNVASTTTPWTCSRKPPTSTPDSISDPADTLDSAIKKSSHLAGWVGCRVVVGIIERLVPDELWELFQ
ncbi:hypothetical protein, partial [Streptomyces sp. NPDC059378]|uniref:hypothetical protein n=1 Tax=Streptomyces sp. NPDC059378 TaxID=3346815 RepID=UPI003683CA74